MSTHRFLTLSRFPKRSTLRPSHVPPTSPVAHIYTRACQCETAAPPQPQTRFACVIRFSSLCGLQDFRDCFRDAVPVGALGFELSFALACEFIKLRSSIIFGQSPLRFDPTAFLHPV